MSIINNFRCTQCYSRLSKVAEVVNDDNTTLLIMVTTSMECKHCNNSVRVSSVVAKDAT